MIGCTRLSGKGILSAHYMLYILHQYIQLMSIVLAPNPICMKRIQRKSDWWKVYKEKQQHDWVHLAGWEGFIVHCCICTHHFIYMYILHLNIQLISTALVPKPMCLKPIQWRSDWWSWRSQLVIDLSNYTVQYKETWKWAWAWAQLGNEFIGRMYLSHMHRGWVYSSTVSTHQADTLSSHNVTGAVHFSTEYIGCCCKAWGSTCTSTTCNFLTQTKS